MTKEEAIEKLELMRQKVDEETYRALILAIKALSQEPCERFEWGIDGNVYKITKAKDGKEICQQVCKDAISREAVQEAFAEYVASGFAESVADFEGYTDIIMTLPSVTQKSGTETWNGIHGQITAPKGTFDRIFNDADDNEDDI